MVDPFRNPDGHELEGATWYTDGSLICGQWTALKCTGFGVVVVAANGRLIGYGFGAAPSRIATAAAAELWAIDHVLAMNPTAPLMKTDRMSILTAARSGAASVTAASKPLYWPAKNSGPKALGSMAYQSPEST